MHIAIIGCGVAGQAAALFLARAGHKVTVVERFLQPAPVGAGLLSQRFDSTRVMIGVLPIGRNPAAQSGDWVTLFWSLRQRDRHLATDDHGAVARDPAALLADA